MKNRHGQSIIEIIIATAVGVILIMSGVAIISPVLKISSNVARIQTASALGKELLENARVLGESNWHTINSLSIGSTYPYYIMATSSPFRVATGTEAVLVATTTYTRFFYLENVYRSAGGEIAGSGSLDPSTKKITVVYVWPPNASNTMVSYLTRSNDEVMFNTDWTGGGNQAGPVTVTTTNSRFATSSSIDYTGQPGSVVITGF